MFGKSFEYFASLAVLVALAVLHQTIADRWLVPPPVESVPPAKRATLRTNESVAQLFPDSAWQRGATKQLQTRDAVLLFGEVTPGEDNANVMTFNPVTVVYGRGLQSDPNSKPLILEAEKAILEFSSALDMNAVGSGAPIISQGQLVGAVRIRSAREASGGNVLVDGAPGGDANVDIDIRTSNISINKRQLWTTKDLSMRFGDVIIEGRDLRMDLVAAAGAKMKGAKSIVEKMDLVYLNRLELPLQSPVGSKINIECGGHVEYDFAVDQLKMSDTVSFIRTSPGLPVDRFDCNRLELVLRDPLNTDLKRNGPLDWIDEVVAMGATREPAMLNMPSSRTQLTAHRVHLRAIDGVLEATGAPDTERGRGAPVGLRYGDVIAGLPNLIYRFDTKSPQRIGNVSVRGGGRIDMRREGVPLTGLTWSNSLEIEPLSAPAAEPTDEPTSLQLPERVRVNIVGDVQASFTDGGQFVCQNATCELASQPSTDSSHSSRPFANAVREPKTKSLAMVPTSFRATGNVQLDTPTLLARTDELALLFSSVPEGPSRTSPEREQAIGGMPKWVSEPSKTGQPTSPVARSRPSIQGRRIGANLVIQGGNLSPDDLSVTGGVELKHFVNVGEQALPTVLRGDQLRLIGSPGKELLQLSSSPNQPARLEMGDGHFVGPTIQIRPADNIVEMNQAGEFRMPTEILPRLAGEQAEPVQWTKAPLCRWNGAMLFDGSKVRLNGGVTIDASIQQEDSLWDLEMRGDTLTVTLNRPVRLSNVAELRQATIAQLSLTRDDGQPVSVDAKSTTSAGVVSSRHLLRTPEIVFVPTQGGQLIGRGPGSYWAWLKGEVKAGLRGRDEPNDPNNRPRNTREAAQMLAQQNRSTSTSLDPSVGPLTGMHLTFYDQFIGQLQNRRLDFYRDVRIGVRPARDWDDGVDVTAMGELKQDEMTVVCEHLRLAIDPNSIRASSSPAFASSSREIGRTSIAKPAAAWEMLADGGVAFRNRRAEGEFVIEANDASYQSGKDVLILRAGGNRLVRLSRSHPVQGAFQGAFDFFSMENLRQGDLKVQSRMRSSQMGQIPNVAPSPKSGLR